MPPVLGTIHARLAPMGSRRVSSARAVAAALLVVGTAGAGCSKSDPQFEELRRWERVETLRHADVIPYDRVATTAGPNGVAWLTWAASRDDVLAYREVPDGGEVAEVELAAPGVPVLIPIGVATDGDGWVAVAATRDRPNGENTGLMVWQPAAATASGAAGRSVSPSARPRGQVLPPPAGTTATPEAVNTGRAAGTSVVAGVADGQAVAWTSRDGGRWRSTVLELGLDVDLTAIDLAGHGGELVLAGVDADGGAHAWTSPDGVTWEPGPTDDLPGDVRSVTLLASLDEEELALAWLAGGADDAGPRAGTTATVQRFDGRRVVDEGTIEARPEAGIPTFSLDGAALSPDGNLVVVGTASPAADTGVPMIWLRDGDTWEPSTQRELAGRIDHQFRAITTTSDDEMVGLITPASHIDLEVWRWSAGQ